ncbi:MAG TPA: sigma-70 family RNA polymerase sigma factor [Gemmatimonadales bacterium]|nr:sigma-70 family RNA polymerase sigma factor [Gemmatimonadales bacterium]
MQASQARFQTLVQPHLERLLRFAGRRLRNPADAEDVVQEACTRAWLAFADLRDDALVLPWLYRILRSSLSDHFEKRARREQLAPTLALESAGDALHDQGASPLENLIALASTERIHELLRMLPEEFALAIELHDLEGFRYADIANLTGVPPGTVMSRIYRGRKLLAALILMNESLSDLAPFPATSTPQLHVRRA